MPRTWQPAVCQAREPYGVKPRAADSRAQNAIETRPGLEPCLEVEKGKVRSMAWISMSFSS